MRLILMGPPGAGKGTQAARIADRFAIPAVSTGDTLRAHLADGTPIGLAVKTYMDAGEYVPDDLIDALVLDRLALPDCDRGFLLDGYPRTLEQVKELDTTLTNLGMTLDAVVVLTVETDELIDRLLRPASIEGRADDTEAVIRRRQENYQAQTAPLAEEYDARDLLVRVDGTGHVDHVTASIHNAITGHGPRPIDSETRHDLAEPKRHKHLMVPGEARPTPRRPTSITTVQRWVITALLLVITGILAAGIVVIATLADLARPGARPGLLIIAAGFGVVAVGGCLLIHQRRPLSPWLLAGLLPSLVGAYFCYLA